MHSEIRSRWLGAALLAPCLGFLTLFALYPIANSIYLSLHRIVLGLPGLGRSFVGLENYRQLLTDPTTMASLGRTVLFVLVSTLLEISFGLIIALVIHQRFRGRGLVRAAVLVPWAVPTVVASQLWRFLFNDKYGLVNYLVFGADTSLYRAWLAHPIGAFAAVVVADVWKTSAFAALLILAGLQTIPDELYEAATIDGAGSWYRFRHITLPLLRPAILVALLFRTMDAFRVFDLVFVMTQGGPGDATNVLQFHGYKTLIGEGQLGYGSAISVLVLVLTLTVCLLYLWTLGSRWREAST